MVPMERSTKVLSLVLLSLILLSGMYYYVGRIEPRHMYPGSISTGDEGVLVRVEGAVSNPKVTDHSAHFHLVDTDDGAMVKVFCDFGPREDVRENLVPGALVEVVGEVTVYDGRPEVMVKDDNELWIRGGPDRNEIDLRIIVRYPDAFDNMTVSTMGEVSGVSFDWGQAGFLLELEGVCVNVTVSDFSPQVPFYDGTTLRVVGRLWFDDEGHMRISAKGWESITVII